MRYETGKTLTGDDQSLNVLFNMTGCKLCHENESGTWIKQYSSWNLGVCPYQHTLGTLVVVSKIHKELFPEITTEEFLELQDIIRMSYGILEKTFHPDWFNLQQNGNWERHLHFQIFPRYREKRIFEGRTFIDQSFNGPVQYTKEIEGSVFINAMTRLLQ